MEWHAAAAMWRCVPFFGRDTEDVLAGCLREAGKRTPTDRGNPSRCGCSSNIRLPMRMQDTPGNVRGSQRETCTYIIYVEKLETLWPRGGATGHNSAYICRAVGYDWPHCLSRSTCRHLLGRHAPSRGDLRRRTPRPSPPRKWTSWEAQGNGPWNEVGDRGTAGKTNARLQNRLCKRRT